MTELFFQITPLSYPNQFNASSKLRSEIIFQVNRMRSSIYKWLKMSTIISAKYEITSGI